MRSTTRSCLALLGANVALAATTTAPWMNLQDTPEARAAALLSNLTLAEKLHFFHGSGSGYVGNVAAQRGGAIPALTLNDGPQGFRGISGTSTAWPSALGVAATWSKETAHAWGDAMGDEFFRKGANVQLGPGMCVARVPRNGRNFEYLSGEDPALGTTIVPQVVAGIQGQHVIANAKHYVNNNQETNRGSVSENVDERTQFEIYYPPFEAAAAAGVGSVMVRAAAVAAAAAAAAAARHRAQSTSLFSPAPRTPLTHPLLARSAHAAPASARTTRSAARGRARTPTRFSAT